MRVGVLAAQGDFAAHARALERAGAEAVLVRKPRDLAGVEGLVLPGGESTAMLHALARDGLEAPLADFVRSGRPVLATCAGTILLARGVRHPAQRSLGALDVDVERNAYGTQLDSFTVPVDAGSAFPGLRAIFIRAPRIVRVGPGVEVLARVRGHPVLVQSRRIWAATFHPELGDDDRVVREWFDGGPPAGANDARTPMDSECIACATADPPRLR
ncbi:MAG TPA: pyridoxal 5'-phosphate synthase glutaminase subunit PdxT [Candidatus Binatia bacterium]|nr:pyridoxal 5'-phosphate synthase glutaminase subunit PdxT [Candidatus Binatia bacterium]